MLISIDDFYSVEFYNTCKEALLNNGVPFKEYVSITGNYKWYLDLPTAPIMIQLTQLPTQNNQGGVSDIYKRFGTYLKSIYTVIQRPDAVKIGIFTTNGNSNVHHSDTRRLHHKCDVNLCFVKIVSDRYAQATIPYSEVEQPELNPDFYNQTSYMDLLEPDLNDTYIESRLMKDW